MRSWILPHLVADESHWQLGGWRLADGTPLRGPSSMIGHWDFEYVTSLSCEVLVNSSQIIETCGVGQGARLTLLTVASFSVTEVPVVTSRLTLDVSSAAAVEVQLEIDPQVAGGTVTLERHVVLEEAGRSPSKLAAQRRGSVLLAEGEDAHRIQLEGEGARFPTELLDFSVAGVGDTGALWFLDVDTSRLTDPVSAAVRLYVNSGHPAVKRMQQEDSEAGSAVASVMGWDVARQLVRTVLSDSLFADEAGSFEEGSLGQVVENLVEFYMAGEKTESVQQLLREQPGVYERRMQAATGVLGHV